MLNYAECSAYSCLKMIYICIPMNIYNSIYVGLCGYALCVFVYLSVSRSFSPSSSLRHLETSSNCNRLQEYSRSNVLFLKVPRFWLLGMLIGCLIV